MEYGELIHDFVDGTLDSNLEIADSREHDNREVKEMILDVLEDFDPVDPRHSHINEGEVIAFRLQQIDCLYSV